MRDDRHIVLKISTPHGRLKHVRKLAKLSRKEIEARYGLPESTLKAWENGTAIITSKGLQRCEAIYRKLGVVLSREWVLHGKGLPPQFSVDIGRYFASAYSAASMLITESTKHDLFIVKDRDQLRPYLQSEEMCMVQEASFFKELYPDAVVLIVSDDDMLPKYRAGDYVGGRFRYGKDIEAAVNRDCIVRLPDGTDMLRHVVRSRAGAGYNLVSTNPHTTSREPVLFNVNVVAVAPVIWHRMPNN